MKWIIAVPLWASGLFAADCLPSHLSEQETLARFQSLDREAQSAFDRGQFAAAARYYREAACLAPKSARAFYGLGIAEAAANNFVAARTDLETAFALLPDNPLPIAMLVRVNVAMKDIEKLKEVLRTAAEGFPGNGELHSGLARFLAENGLLDLALAESLRFEQTGARDAASAVALAALENTVGAYDDAIRNATSVESQTDASAAVRASAAGIAGLSYESSGRRDEAIQHLRSAIELAPAEENSYLALADLYEKTQKFDDAVAVLEEGSKHIPGAVNFLLPLANNLVWAEHFNRGLEVLNDLIQKQPKVVDAYVRTAEAYRKMGRPELEAETLRKLARIQPDYPRVHVLTAQALLNIDPVDTAKVLQELAQAEKASPNDADIFYTRGKLYLAANRPAEAITALKRAIELRPLEPGPYYQLGLTYRKLGRTQLARQMFERLEHIKQTAATP